MNKYLYVETKTVYGNELVYPKCERSQVLAKLCGTKTFTEKHIRLILKLGYIHVTFAIFLAFYNIIISDISNHVYQRYCHFFIFRTEITFFVYLASKLVNSLNCWFLCNTVNATDSSVNWPENS